MKDRWQLKMERREKDEQEEIGDNKEEIWDNREEISSKN